MAVKDWFGVVHVVEKVSVHEAAEFGIEVTVGETGRDIADLDAPHFAGEGHDFIFVVADFVVEVGFGDPGEAVPEAVLFVVAERA